MRISVVCPVLNEVDFIGYSIMSCLDQMHEFIYALDEKTDDGTRDLLNDIKSKYAHEKLIVLETPNFHPSDTKAYNAAFNVCIDAMSGEAAYFYHPDMIIQNPEALLTMPPALAWWTNVRSYAGDFQTVITKGRCDKWKNIHVKKFGLHYYGGYGSQNEDFYHSEISGKSYRHHGIDFKKYPFSIRDSGIQVLHFCELKEYSRRLEKMKRCLRTQYPEVSEEWIEEKAAHHPRVTLEASSRHFGEFEFTKIETPVPAVIEKYRNEFEAYQRRPVWLTK